MLWAGAQATLRSRKNGNINEFEYEDIWTRYYREISEVADLEGVERPSKLMPDSVPIYSMITKVHTNALFVGRFMDYY